MRHCCIEMNQPIITGLLISSEVLIGALLGHAYIIQYSLLTSEQSLGQFFATVILIYSATVFSFGIVNLRLIKKLETKIIIRSIVTSLALGTIFAVPIFILPYETVDNLDFWDLSPLAVILLGMVIGFNFQLLRANSASNNATQHRQ
jgi:hypothetical protein